MCGTSLRTATCRAHHSIRLGRRRRQSRRGSHRPRATAHVHPAHALAVAYANTREGGPPRLLCIPLGRSRTGPSSRRDAIPEPALAARQRAPSVPPEATHRRVATASRKPLPVRVVRVRGSLMGSSGNLPRARLQGCSVARRTPTCCQLQAFCSTVAHRCEHLRASVQRDM
jgi:hypothetical protein